MSTELPYKKLKNPCTTNYTHLKDYILGPTPGWCFYKHAVLQEPEEGYEQPPMMTLHFLSRPEPWGHSLIASDYFCQAHEFVLELLAVNGVVCNRVLRLAANIMFPTATGKPASPHIDHEEMRHNNLIVYLNDSSGDTVVDGHPCSPKEDEVIMFPGLKHYVVPPSTNDYRVVLVATFQ